MKKAQLNTTYALLILGISFLMLVGVFAASELYKKSATQNAAGEFGEAVLNKALATIAEMKVTVNSTTRYTDDVRNFTRIFEIPETVGDQRYLLAGRNTILEFRTLGKPQIVKNTNITLIWENATIDGASGSSAGKVKISFIGPGRLRLS
ncbi:MAG: hypothetical protein HYT16_02370 [DPANN group archaeon]|nr:hypothetical protein [DPANN group archaeon]